MSNSVLFVEVTWVPQTIVVAALSLCGSGHVLAEEASSPERETKPPCVVDPDLRSQDQLICSRSKEEIYQQSPIHLRCRDNLVVIPFFGNRACPMSGDPVLPDAFYEYQGQRVYFCCQKCARDGSQSAKAWHQRAYPTASEPWKICQKLVPSRSKLGQESEGKTRQEDRQQQAAELPVFQGRPVQRCHEECQKSFQENPIRSLTLGMFPRARFANNDRCPVSGEEAQPDILAIHQNTVLQFGSWSDLREFMTQPDKYPPDR